MSVNKNRVAVLGCGFHGRGVAYQLGASDLVSKLIIADKDEKVAAKVAKKIGTKAIAQPLDISDTQNLNNIMKQVDIVVNLVGPFHKLGLGVIQASIENKVNYVDINDDYDLAEQLFLKPDYNEAAKKAGVTILTCMGGDPGLPNVLAKYASQQMRCKAIHIYTALFLAGDSPTGNDHMLHAMAGEVPQYLNGKYTRVKPHTGNEMIQFIEPFGSVEQYYYGHPEPITLPIFIPSVQEVTTKIGVIPAAANNLLSDFVKYGFTSNEHIPGLTETPLQWAMIYISQVIERNFKHQGNLEWPFCTMVEILGENNGHPMRLVYEILDNSRRTITGSAAIAALDIIEGKVTKKGVTAPEDCLQPEPFIRKMIEQPGVVILERRDTRSQLDAQTVIP